mmetsp:Transcript_130788/g.244703  ORF Transcript_130788/g.244703 Transcript_130788/m.244703 type:complete len:209 (+) Transcript_130788:619-1245(+)
MTVRNCKVMPVRIKVNGTRLFANLPIKALAIIIMMGMEPIKREDSSVLMLKLSSSTKEMPLSMVIGPAMRSAKETIKPQVRRSQNNRLSCDVKRVWVEELELRSKVSGMSFAVKSMLAVPHRKSILNTVRHPKTPPKTPPTDGAEMIARGRIPASNANMRIRSLGSSIVSRATADVIASFASPTACTTRAAISQPIEGANEAPRVPTT